MIGRRAGVAFFVTCAGALLVAAGGPAAAGGTGTDRGTPMTRTPRVTAPPDGWTSFGNGPQHDFVGRTTLSTADVGRLHQAWFFPTGDAVTATPTVARGTVYFGSWDTKFYAVSLATGKLRWSYQLDPQTAVTPYPGEHPRNAASDGGLVTSSAWYEPAGPGHPDLVIFGGGYTLYALDADTGALFWKHVYDGRPWRPPSPTTDGTRIFSSPIVEDGNVYVGVDNDSQLTERGYIVAANLRTGDPTWTYQTDVGPHGQVLDDGCGNVWSSGTYLPGLDDVVFTVADCHFGGSLTTTAERVLSLDARTGRLRWSARVVPPAPRCDFDEVGTNAGISASGATDFLGAYGKDGTYTSLNPATGAVRWSTRVVFGGSSGGFIGSPAYDGSTVFGATAIGDAIGGPVCMPGHPGDTSAQVSPSFFAIDATTGKVLWTANDARSLGSTTYAGGLLFTCPVFSDALDVRDAANGSLLATPALPNACWGGVAVVGDRVLVPIGTSPQGTPGGVVALVPGPPGASGPTPSATAPPTS